MPDTWRGGSSVTLERTVRELQGIPCIALEEAPPDRKTIMASRSFGRLVTARSEMDEAVASYVTRATEKMRRQQFAAGRLMVFLQTNPFRPQDPQYARERQVQLRSRPPIPARSSAPRSPGWPQSGARDFTTRRRA